MRHALGQRWSQDGSDHGKQAGRRLRQAPAKAWRFVGEMAEIAATFHAAGVPDGFRTAAAKAFGRMARFKDPSAAPALEDVLIALRQTQEAPGASSGALA